MWEREISEEIENREQGGTAHGSGINDCREKCESIDDLDRAEQMRTHRMRESCGHIHVPPHTWLAELYPGSSFSSPVGQNLPTKSVKLHLQHVPTWYNCMIHPADVGLEFHRPIGQLIYTHVLLFLHHVHLFCPTLSAFLCFKLFALLVLLEENNSMGWIRRQWIWMPEWIYRRSHTGQSGGNKIRKDSVKTIEDSLKGGFKVLKIDSVPVASSPGRREGTVFHINQKSLRSQLDVGSWRETQAPSPAPKHGAHSPSDHRMSLQKQLVQQMSVNYHDVHISWQEHATGKSQSALKKKLWPAVGFRV